MDSQKGSVTWYNTVRAFLRNLVSLHGDHLVIHQPTGCNGSFCARSVAFSTWSLSKNVSKRESHLSPGRFDIEAWCLSSLSLSLLWRWLEQGFDDSLLNESSMLVFNPLGGIPIKCLYISRWTQTISYCRLSATTLFQRFSKILNEWFSRQYDRML